MGVTEFVEKLAIELKHIFDRKSDLRSTVFPQHAHDRAIIEASCRQLSWLPARRADHDAF
jgi:hypothetical protein